MCCLFWKKNRRKDIDIAKNAAIMLGYYESYIDESKIKNIVIEFQH